MSMGRIVYLVDVGVLYTEKTDENEMYFSAYDKKYGYYDENQFYVADKNKAINFVTNYVNDGVDNTYGIVLKTEMPYEISDDELDDTSVEGESYEVDDVVFSIAKINDKIEENFIKN